MLEQIEECRILYHQVSNILDNKCRILISRPIEGEALALGIISRGDRPAEARKKIESCFASLKESTRRGAVMEICGTFERIFLKVLPNPVGEIRKVVEKEFKLRLFRSVRIRLVKDASAYETLDAQFAILDGFLPTNEAAMLKTIRTHRNEIAHGTIPLSVPNISVDFTAQALCNALLLLGIE